MYCPPAKFGVDMSSGFCVVVLTCTHAHTHTHTHTYPHTHPYRAVNRSTHVGGYVGVSNQSDSLSVNQKSIYMYMARYS